MILMASSRKDARQDDSPAAAARWDDLGHAEWTFAFGWIVRVDSMPWD
jgi:hypothetical protein